MIVFQISGGVEDGKSFVFQWAQRCGNVGVSAVGHVGRPWGLASRGLLPCSSRGRWSFGGSPVAHTIPENTPSYPEKTFRK